MKRYRFLSRWALVAAAFLLLGQLQVMGDQFERLPVFEPQDEIEPLQTLSSDVVLQSIDRPIQRLDWLGNQDPRPPLAIGQELGGVQLASMDDEQSVPIVHSDVEPILEPIPTAINSYVKPESDGEPGSDDEPISNDDPGCYWDPYPSSRLNSCWTFSAEALALWRTRSRDIKIVEEGTAAPPRGQRNALLTTDALKQDPALGPRFSIFHYLNDARQLEFTYFGLNHWTSQAAFDGINGVGFSFLNIDVPFDANITSDFDGAQYVSATYTSDIHSAELNIRTNDRWDLHRSAGYPWYEYVDFIAGFRYFRLSEEFDLAATDAGQTSNYLIDTSNDLLGTQFGMFASSYCSPTVSWNTVAKAGVYANLGKQNTLLRDDDNTVLLRDFSTKDEELAFIGELNFNLTKEIRPNVRLTGGYSLVYLDGVALAPEQLDFTTTATSGSALNQNGSVLFHGLSAGLQIDH